MRGLYLLTPDLADTADLVRRVEDAMRPGVATLLQYRNKAANRDVKLEQLRAIAPLCAAHGVALVVNDDVDLAAGFGAGVHVGEHDDGVANARARLGAGAIVGASCYDDAARAIRAQADGASYVAFGAFSPSTTKPNARRASLALLREPSSLPKVAIGGITADNARPLLDAGADLLAVLGDVFDARDIAAAVRRYAPLFQDRP